jgi:cytochrome P450
MVIEERTHLGRATDRGGLPTFRLHADVFDAPGDIDELVSSNEYRLFCEGRLASPYGLLAWLRENDPVHFSPILSAWILTRYDDVYAGLRDARFKNDRVSASMSALPVEMQTSCAPLGEHVSNWLGYTDPPKHTRLRGLVRPTFTPALPRTLAKRIHQIVDALIDRLLLLESPDLVSDFASRLPAQVVCEILGIPEDDENRFAQWSDAMVAFTGHIGPTLVDIAPRAMSGYVELEDFFEGLVAERSRCPAGDLVTELASAEAGGKLSRQELIGLSVFTLVAGHETTASLIATTAWLMLTNTTLRQALTAQPDLYPVAIEEVLRLEPPIQFSPRLAGDDVPLRGQTIRRGDAVILHAAAANRDPAHATDPDVLDLNRRDTRHLSFGWHAHYCLGAPLARAETAIALERLFERIPNLRLAGDNVAWRENMTIRAPRELAVLW